MVSRTDEHGVTPTYRYDAGAYGKGRLTSATDAAGSTTFTYDTLGRVTEEARVTDGVSYATGYAYSGTTGDLVGMTYPTGLVLTFQRDAVGRISAVTAGAQTIAGNVAYLPFGPVEAMDLGAVSVTRAYDARYQVTGIQAGTALNYTYTRDGVGNITGLGGATKPPFASGTTDYAYTANRLVSSTGAKPAAYTYDNAGNITSDGARDFVYNQNNRLVRVEAGGTVLAEYAYDGFERRVKKVAGGVTVHYHYDLNGRLIAETDGAGNPIRDYVYIDGEPVAMQVYGAGAGWYWFLNDHLGTPQKLVDNAGAVVWQAAYMPFGEARVLEATVENNLRFPGQYYDAETGLHYNWHRYYDPETGRYLRPDPIGLAGGINLFAYVQNNPINYIDRNGLDWIDVQNMIVDISNKYELSKPDSVLYTPMSPDDMGKADRWKNIIELPREEFDRKLTEREFDALYQTIYHEMRHLNAPDWQESIDFFSEFFVDIGPFHLKIYQEELMVEPSEGLYEKNNCK